MAKAMLTLAPEVLARHEAIVKKALKDVVGRTYLGVEGGQPAFAYPRVSGGKQAEADRTGIAREIKAIDTLASRLGRHIPFENIYADDYTGQEEIRPHLDRLVAHLEQVPPATRLVLAESMDRIGRLQAIQYLVGRRIKRAGGELKLSKEMDEMTRLAFGFAAEVELVNIKIRTRGANVVRMARGEVISNRARFGYDIVRGPAGAHFQIDEREARIVRLIHRWFQCYRSIVKLQYSLHRRGVRGPRGGTVWSTDTLLGILRDESYVGRHYQNRYVVERTGEYTRRGRPQTKTTERPRSEWIVVEVPVIVDAGLFEANQKLLNANRGRSGRKPRLSLLRSLLHCTCGRRMTVTRNERGVEYYSCPRRSDSEVKRHGRPRCEQRFIRVVDLDALIWDRLAEFLQRPALMQRLMREQHQEAGAAGDRSSLMRAVRDADRALQATRDGLDAALTRGEAPPELIDAATRARARLEAAQAELDAYTSPPPPPTLEQVRERLARFDPATVALERRHAIALALIDRALVQADGQTVHIEGVLPEPKSFGMATHCACAPTGSSWARSAVGRRSTCSRP